jgi:hypothetical protein
MSTELDRRLERMVEEFSSKRLVMFMEVEVQAERRMNIVLQY